MFKRTWANTEEFNQPLWTVDGLQGVPPGSFAGLWSLLPGPHAARGYHFHPLGINVLQSSQPFSGLSDEAPDKHYSQSMHFQSR